jgi:3-deoxy-D-manno-octulosonic-acid transferase
LRRWSVLVALSPYFLYQALRHKKYVGSLRQRLGYLPVALNLDGEPSIWIHAVSVGEVLSTRPIIEELRKRYPALRLFLSTTTRSGQQLARRSVTDVDGIFYFPFDWPFTVRRALAVVQAEAVRHDRKRDLADAAARMPPPRHSRPSSSTAESRRGRFRATA